VKCRVVKGGVVQCRVTKFGWSLLGLSSWHDERRTKIRIRDG
jgi:hypothetical protein